jgi:hypothetical protein
MGEAFVQRVGGGVNNVGRRIEVRFANLEVDNIAALGFEGTRFHQDFERSLGAEPGHTGSETEIGQLIHERGKNRRSSRRSLAIFWW